MCFKHFSRNMILQHRRKPEFRVARLQCIPHCAMSGTYTKPLQEVYWTRCGIFNMKRQRLPTNLHTLIFVLRTKQIEYIPVHIVVCYVCECERHTVGVRFSIILTSKQISFSLSIGFLIVC